MRYIVVEYTYSGYKEAKNKKIAERMKCEIESSVLELEKKYKCAIYGKSSLPKKAEIIKIPDNQKVMFEIW